MESVSFGVSPAPESIFQRVQRDPTDGLDGVECIHDDFLVYGCVKTVQDAIEDHDKKLEKISSLIVRKWSFVRLAYIFLTANGIEAAIRDGTLANQ